MPKISVKDSEEWKIYQNKAKQDVLFANIVYPDEDSKLQEAASQLPSNYEMILYTDSLDDTKEHRYRAAVYVNHKTKEVLVTNCGTRFGIKAEGREDLWNDGFLATGQVPPKFSSALKINKIILDSLGEEAGNYNYHYTGHSLGAYLAASQASALALEMQERGIPIKDLEGKPKISSMTFENPGAKQIIEKLYIDKGLDPTQHSSDVEHVVINNRKNFINQLGKQTGKIYEIVPEGTEKEPNIFQMFCHHVSITLKNWGLPYSLFEIGSFGSIRGQVSSHLLDKFVNVIVEEKGDIVTGEEDGPKKSFLEVITNCIQVIFNKDIFKNLFGMKETSDSIGKQEFVMASAEANIQEIEMVTFSKEELQKASRENIRATAENNPISRRIIEERAQSPVLNFVDRVANEAAPKIKQWKPLTIEEVLGKNGREL